MNGGLAASGLARGFKAGQQRIKELRADRNRFYFCVSILNGEIDMGLTATEGQFVCRIVAETDEASPVIHSGDRNICDALMRKYKKATGGAK